MYLFVSRFSYFSLRTSSTRVSGGMVCGEIAMEVYALHLLDERGHAMAVSCCLVLFGESSICMWESY